MTATPGIDDRLREAQGHLQARRPAEAARVLRLAATEAPDDPRVDLLAASVAGARHDHAGALAAIDAAIVKGLTPPPQIVFARIHALYTLGRLDEAITAIETTEADPGSPLAHNLLGLRAKCLEREGDLDDLRATLDLLAAVEGESPRIERLRASLDRRAGDRDAAIARLERTLDRPDAAPPDRMGAAFDLARLLDAAGRFDEAFEAATVGNRMATPGFDPVADARTVSESIAASSRAAMDAWPTSSIDSPRPVFIVGMPRSGTSLLEQIVASHPQAGGVGERQDPFILLEDLAADTGRAFPDLLAAAGVERLDAAATAYLTMLDRVGATESRVTNKALGLDRVVGFLARLLPGARFLWIHRDPRDAILSAYLHQIHQPWAWRLEHLIAAHEAHERLRTHWVTTLPERSLAVAYETLVADPTGSIDRVVEHLGLTPDPRCHRFHESDRVVLTPSHDQVRVPMNRRGVDRWQRYATHLGPVMARWPSAASDEAE